MSIETLQNNFWKLQVHPRLGASPVALEAMASQTWQPVMRPTNPELLEGDNSASFSSYNLAPYSNRIKNNKFVFEGREYQMKPNWADGIMTIHGDIRNRALDMTRQKNALEFWYDSRVVTDSNYPFDYTFKTSYALEDDVFVSHLEVQNVGNVPMPAGLGYHPYFMPTFLGSSAAPVLHFQASSVYLTDTTRIPDAGSQAIPPGLDFSSPKAATGFFIDNVYNDWDGVATFEWTGSGYGLRIEGDPIYSHFVVFNGDPDGTVALEPVSHCTDGFNLMAQGVPNTGVKVLAPGEILAGAMRLKLEKLT
jgi:aldose 1-epimerase